MRWLWAQLSLRFLQLDWESSEMTESTTNWKNKMGSCCYHNSLMEMMSSPPLTLTLSKSHQTLKWSEAPTVSPTYKVLGWKRNPLWYGGHVISSFSLLDGQLWTSISSSFQFHFSQLFFHIIHMDAFYLLIIEFAWYLGPILLKLAISKIAQN